MIESVISQILGFEDEITEELSSILGISRFFRGEGTSFWGNFANEIASFLRGEITIKTEINEAFELGLLKEVGVKVNKVVADFLIKFMETVGVRPEGEINIQWREGGRAQAFYDSIEETIKDYL